MDVFGNIVEYFILVYVFLFAGIMFFYVFEWVENMVGVGDLVDGSRFFGIVVFLVFWVVRVVFKFVDFIGFFIYVGGEFVGIFVVEVGGWNNLVVVFGVFWVFSSFVFCLVVLLFYGWVIGYLFFWSELFEIGVVFLV